MYVTIRTSINDWYLCVYAIDYINDLLQFDRLIDLNES